MEANEVGRTLGALSQPHRLRIFRALVAESGMTPGALVGALALPAATLSFHLKELMNAGLVSQQRDGRHLVYRASFGRIQSLVDYLTANCCQGASCGANVGPAFAVSAAHLPKDLQ